MTEMFERYQRREMRAEVFGEGSLTWNDGLDGARTSSVTVRNLSSQGLQVVCRKAIRAGASVFLTGETYECLGTVKYCVYSDEGFRIGIELEREPYHRANDDTAIF
ncbi:MAG: hypothetical protein R2748_31610 [Bryobacterales bacterium]